MLPPLSFLRCPHALCSKESSTQRRVTLAGNIRESRTQSNNALQNLYMASKFWSNQSAFLSDRSHNATQTLGTKQGRQPLRFAVLFTWDARETRDWLFVCVGVYLSSRKLHLGSEQSGLLKWSCDERRACSSRSLFEDCEMAITATANKLDV